MNNRGRNNNSNSHGKSGASGSVVGANNDAASIGNGNG